MSNVGEQKRSEEHGFAARVQDFLRKDAELNQIDSRGKWRTIFGFDLIIAFAFGVMSIVNIYQHSMVMLAFTGIASIAMFIVCGISFPYKHVTLLRWCVVIECGIVFTVFVIMGGNNGFAALWLVLVPVFAMVVVSFRVGFGLSAYFFIFLLLFFYTPLYQFSMFQYDSTFMLRFPFLYLISFALGAWTAIRLEVARYEIYRQKRELDRIVCDDALTGLLNRLGFTRFVENFDYKSADCISVMYADVDGLHETNNEQGHEAGDALLVGVANELKRTFYCCSTFRMGGDEFLAVCENCNLERITACASKFKEGAHARGQHVSTGCAAWERSTPDEKCDLDALVFEADHIMLENKRIFHESHPEFDRRKTR